MGKLRGTRDRVSLRLLRSTLVPRHGPVQVWGPDFGRLQLAVLEGRPPHLAGRVGCDGLGSAHAVITGAAWLVSAVDRCSSSLVPTRIAWDRPA